MRTKLRKYSVNRQHTFFGTLAKKGKHLLITDVCDAGTGMYVSDHMWITPRKKLYPTDIPIDTRIKFTGTVCQYAHDFFTDPTKDDFAVGKITKLVPYDTAPKSLNTLHTDL